MSPDKPYEDCRITPSFLCLYNNNLSDTKQGVKNSLILNSPVGIVGKFSNKPVRTRGPVFSVPKVRPCIGTIVNSIHGS